MTTATKPSVSNGNKPTMRRPSQYVDGGRIAVHTAEPVTHLAWITPDTAESWLGRNSHNRKIRQSQVDMLVGAIRRGEWKLNGDAIRWDTNGILSDGQHRLWAIFTTEIPVPSLVITGLPPDAQETMDMGARRSLKDVLSLRGETSASNVAATLTYWWRYTNGYVRNGGVRPSVAQAVAVLEANPTLRDAIRQAERVGRRFRVSAAMVASCVYDFESIDADAAYAFFDKLVTGVGLVENDPILALRRHLEVNTAAGVNSRASVVTTHALFIKAWNAYRDGRHVTHLNWKSIGTKAEEFPTPK